MLYYLFFHPARLTEKDGTIYKVPSVSGSAEEFYNAVYSLGHINTLPDTDQIMRKFPVWIKSGDDVYPQISLEMSRIYNKQDRIDLEGIGLRDRFIFLPMEGLRLRRTFLTLCLQRGFIRRLLPLKKALPS